MDSKLMLTLLKSLSDQRQINVTSYRCGKGDYFNNLNFSTFNNWLTLKKKKQNKKTGLPITSSKH